MVGLYLDENVSLIVQKILNHRGFDAVTARDLGMLRASDDQHLDKAIEIGRVLLSHDTDFVQIHIQRLVAGRSHPGIILCPKVDDREVAARVGRFLTMRTADEIYFTQLWA